MSSVTKAVGTGADNTYDGTLEWTGTSNITVNDSSRAQAKSGYWATVYTHLLLGTNCGFAIPTGASIDGIVVVIHAFGTADEGNRPTLFSLRLWNGAVLASKAISQIVAASETTYTYGSSTDVWGATLTPSIINSSTFGVGAVFSLEKGNYPDSFTSAYVDYMEITVYYTPASGPANVAGTDGLVKSSTKAVNALTMASIKGIDGLT